MVTKSGLVLTFGCGQAGRLGHGGEEDITYPKVVERLAKTRKAVLSAACGREHTLVALSSGQVAGWGWGEGGRLGLGEVGAVLWPEMLLEVDRLGVQAASVACGREHSLIVTRCGRVLACGPSDRGRLGLSPGALQGGKGRNGGEAEGRNVVFPRLLSAGVGSALAGEVVVGASAGEMHTVCMCRSGKVFTWGHGETGALGHGSPEDEPLPRLVTGVADAAGRDDVRALP
ncbi:unnamed protein product [Discosporangium mesarthrocarpum]